MRPGDIVGKQIDWTPPFRLRHFSDPSNLYSTAGFRIRLVKGNINRPYIWYGVTSAGYAAIGNGVNVFYVALEYVQPL